MIMAEFCSKCDRDWLEINLHEIALNLKNGFSHSFLCEGCDRRGVYKDEHGAIYIAYEVQGEVELRPAKIEEL